MAIEYNHDEMYDKYRLTDEQLKAAKAVYAAMRKAAKLGVEFWDMYGILSCYNGRVFRSIQMEDIPNGIPAHNAEGSVLVYFEYLQNFAHGQADDPFWLELRPEFDI